MNFIDDFLDFTRDLPSPTAYLMWSAISALSAVARDNIYLYGKHGHLYPNLYILLLGPPAVGKGQAMKAISPFIKAVKNTKIIEGSASIQGVIKTLGQHETGSPIGASCILFAEELAAFAQKDCDTVELLTTLYDYHETWSRTLIGWSAELKKVCISFIMGSNEVLLKEVFNTSALYGGLLSRTILVKEEKKRKKARYENKTQDDTETKARAQKLIDHLKAVAKLTGPVVMEPEALAEMNLWEDSWDEEKRRSKSGIEGRVRTHILKLGTNLTLAEPNLDLIIRKHHIERAIDLMAGLFQNYEFLTTSSGKSAAAHPGALLLSILRNSPNHELSRRRILARHFGEFDSDLLDNTVKTLVGGNLLLEVECSGELSYRLTSEAMEFFERAKAHPNGDGV